MANMQFVVPQFIDVEAKIIGPVSARQFVIMLADLGVCFLVYRLTGPWVFIPTIIILIVLGGSLAFFKVNGMPMHYFLLNLVQTLRRPSLKLWERVAYTEKKIAKKKKKKGEEVSVAPVDRGPVTESRLAEMALMVDTGGAYASQEVRLPEATTSINRTEETGQQAGQQTAAPEQPSDQQPPVQ